MEPFRVVGNVYYVGAADVSAFLIATPQGHILLDTGFRETFPLLEANIRKLGFRLEDIRVLLASHAHYDHAGALAEVKARTKARMLLNPAEVELFTRGGKGDFAFGDAYAFPPVQADGTLQDGGQVRLGGTVVTAHFTPGHTQGCTSYTMKVLEAGRSYDVVFAGSLTAPGYRLVNNPKYPAIVKDFEASFEKLRALPCDVLLGGHSWDFGWKEKLKARTADGPNPFVVPGECAQYVDRLRQAFRKQLGEQQ